MNDSSSSKTPDYDLAIIGGGIAGLGIFERAVQAGLKVILLERGKAGGATTAVTSGLLHGGLRYLSYDVGTSYLMCREIARLRRERPQLLTREAFLWPVYRGHRLGLWLIESLQEYYDVFSELRGGRPHVRISAEEMASVMPELKAEGLLGAVAFDEWRVNVPSLVASLIESGRAAGAELREGWRMSSVSIREGKVTSISDQDGATVKAKFFVNAAGPWAEEVAELAGLTSVKLILRKGVHLILEGPPARHGLIFPGLDGRYLGVYPRKNETWVGPTDDPYHGPPDALATTSIDENGLRQALAKVLPDLATRPGRVVAGLRPIPHQRASAALLSREHRIQDHAPDGLENFMTVTGGKLTTHRPLGDDVVNAVCAKLGRPALIAHADLAGLPFSLMRSRRKTVNLAASAGLLAYFTARHALRGSTRKGLALFKKEFE